ncbi:MAG: hypothetical protein ABWZ98_03780 [Nakamurella sp.]
MIIGAAVCPGAPFLLPGVASSLFTQMQELVMACAEAVGRLSAADSIVLLSTRLSAAGWPPGTPCRELDAGAIAASSVRRSDLPFPAIALRTGGPLAGGAPQNDRSTSGLLTVADPAVGTLVGATLLAAAAPSLPVSIIEIGDPAAAGAALEARTQTAERIALLVIADGSACHGDNAPGRRDDRAAGFDADISAALAAGSPSRLAAACADRALAGELLATVDPLAVLALLTAARPPEAAELSYRGAPFGVGYWVASWQWTPA